MASIVVTGAAGFIGACLAHYFADQKKYDVIEVDDFSIIEKSANFQSHTPFIRIERTDFLTWFQAHPEGIDAVIHMGARTNTTEQNLAILHTLNLRYSQQIWEICTQHSIPLVYASSAATYGNGEHGYSDAHESLPLLRPMNPYGQSKHDFDLWVMAQAKCPPFWAGLKFFNVYGPNEYHKNRMASVVFHAYHQIKTTGSMQLFRSHRQGIADGYQSRDFIYVKDILSVVDFLLEHTPNSAIYNLGSGEANPFYALATATFEAMDLPPQITFIDTPEDIRSNYQYYTCADMGKLVRSGYQRPFYSLEEGIKDYVQNYLIPGKHL